MSSKVPQPPKRARQFLNWFIKPELFEEVEGDLEEQFYAQLQKRSLFRTKLHYWYQVFHYLRPFAFRKSSSWHTNYTIMFRHNFKISWRALRKGKIYSLINIGGLALGMTVTILIGLWIADELTYNKSHVNYDRIGQIMRFETVNGAIDINDSASLPLGSTLQDAYGDEFEHIVVSTQRFDFLTSTQEKKITELGRYMGHGIAEMLGLEMRYGSPPSQNDLNSILISTSLSKKLFGNANPVGEALTLGYDLKVKIGGVYEDLPSNSTFNELHLIASFDLYLSNSQFAQNNLNNWNDEFLRIYAQIPAQSDFETASARIKNIMLPHVDEAMAATNPTFFVHPMSKWRLFSEFENGVNVTSNRLQTVMLYGVIGIFVLILAGINFVNLSTARSEKRAKEVGIRKTVGSFRSQLIYQFLSESLLVAILAFVVSILLVWLSFPWFNEISGKDLGIPWFQLSFWLIGIGFTFFTAFLAGSYPAFYLSSLQPLKVLKGKISGARSALTSRRILVVLQFTVSIALIIGTIVVFQQIQFAKDRSLGYEQDRLLRILKPADAFGKEDVFRSELLQSGVVSHVAESASRLTNIGSNNPGFDWQGKATGFDPVFGTVCVSSEYGKTIGWEVLEGRDFSAELASDSSGIVINESAAKVLGMENPVGASISWNPDFRDKKSYTILGVVKDMVMRSPFEPARPSIFFMDGNKYWMFLKLDAQLGFGDALSTIQPIYEKIAPANVFEYEFVDQLHAAKFGEEERIGNTAALFALLAILISCLGLFGLAAYMAEQRTKEIGIRKVLGASISNLWLMLSKDFMRLVMVSSLIAIPIAYYFLHAWLQNYTYRIEVPFSVFLLVGLGALSLTIFTVSFQAIKAAVANPVKSLRSE